MTRRIVITTTLNDNLFHAKLSPLIKSRGDIEVVVVGDREGAALERVRWVWPRNWIRRFGRLGARLLLLSREIGHSRTGLVMAYNVLPHGLFAVVLGKVWRRPVFLHFISGSAEVSFAHNVLLSGNRKVQKSRYPKRWENLANWAARRADLICVPGSNTLRELTSLGYPANRIVQLHSAIDPDRYFNHHGTRDIDILVAAQLSERKRPLLTLEVFRCILDRRPESRFCWLGDGPLHNEFADAIRKLGLEDALNWTATNDVAPYYQKSKVFLLCSIREGLSLACMEAMACGMVPVTTDCGDMSDVVRNGQTGCLLPVNAGIADFSDAVMSLLENPPLWEVLSHASSNLIKVEHSFPSAIEVWQRILEPLFGKANHSSPL